jgi:hypothetical protein
VQPLQVALLYDRHQQFFQGESLMIRSLFVRLLAAVTTSLALAMGASSALAAGSESVLYVHENPLYTESYLYQPLKNGRARVVTRYGVGEGPVSGTEQERVVSFDQPIVYIITGPGYCWGYEEYSLQMSVEKIVFRLTKGDLRKGQSRVFDLGTSLGLNQCHQGEVKHFGKMSSPGHPMLHRADSQRAGSEDLVPGARLAGMSSDRVTSVDWRWPLKPDIVRFEDGKTLHFESAGLDVPARLNDDGWWMLQFSDFQRGYARFAVDGLHGGERWVRAEMTDQRIQTVRQTLMVKPVAGASFAPAAGMSGRWELARTRHSQGYRQFYDFFDTGTGFIQYATIGAWPLSWWLEGDNLVLDIPPASTPPASYTYVYTWVPLATHGKNHWAMVYGKFVSDTEVRPEAPYISLLVDTGQPAAPPAAR